jgi:hypothetical protein
LTSLLLKFQRTIWDPWVRWRSCSSISSRGPETRRQCPVEPCSRRMESSTFPASNKISCYGNCTGPYKRTSNRSLRITSFDKLNKLYLHT